MSNPPISAYIRTKNEERMIGDVIRAAQQVVSEVVLVDSGSTDKTIDLYSLEGRLALNPRLQLIAFYQQNSENKAKNSPVI